MEVVDVVVGEEDVVEYVGDGVFFCCFVVEDVED